MNSSHLLTRSALFASLSDEERAKIEKQLVRRTFDKDSYLFFEGDAAEWLVFVAEGRVKMLKHSEGGRETILSTFGPGQIVGEVGVLVGDAYPATAQALEPTVALSLRRDEYVDLVRGHPDLAWALIEELGRRLRLTDLLRDPCCCLQPHRLSTLPYDADLLRTVLNEVT